MGMLHQSRPLGQPQRILTPAAGIPLSGLISQWIMDDAHVSGTTVTDSIGSNNATIQDAAQVTSVAGPGSHTARNFAGGNTNSNALLTSTPINWEDPNPWSLAGWVYIADNAANGGDGNRCSFFGSCYGGGPGLRVLNDTNIGAGAFSFGFGGGGSGFGSPPGTLASATWMHFVITNDGSGGGGFAAVNLLYINGLVITTSGETAGLFAGSTESRLGAVDTGAAMAVNGRLYNWLVYNRVITAQEALNIYNAQ